MPVEVHIYSYFSIKTDLAAEFPSWSEFRTGADYDIELAANDSAVSIRFVPATGEEAAFVCNTVPVSNRRLTPNTGARLAAPALRAPDSNERM